MKILAFLLIALTSAKALIIEELHHCLDTIEIDGTVYENWFDTYGILFQEKFGSFPPGISFKSIVKDSLLYIIETNVCFYGDESEPIKIPLKVIFPEADSDTIWASSAMAECLFKSSGAEALFQDGRLLRFYRSGEKWDQTARQFDRLLMEKQEKMDYNDNDPRYIELMQKLKPYYGEKYWKLVQ